MSHTIFCCGMCEKERMTFSPVRPSCGKCIHLAMGADRMQSNMVSTSLDLNSSLENVSHAQVLCPSLADTYRDRTFASPIMPSIHLSSSSCASSLPVSLLLLVSSMCNNNRLTSSSIYIRCMHVCMCTCVFVCIYIHTCR
jgi:hypothetical protein